MTTPDPTAPAAAAPHAPRWLAVGLPLLLVALLLGAVRVFLLPGPVGAVGDCYARSGARDLREVACSDPGARLVVLRAVPDVLATQAEDACASQDGVVGHYWKRASQVSDRGTVLCLGRYVSPS